jgi:MFS family permease
MKATPSIVSQVWALRFVFFSLGFVNANWVSRIPAFRDALKLDHQQLGTALLMGGIGLLAAYPVARWLQTVRTSRWLLYWLGIFNSLALVSIALSTLGTGMQGLMVTLFVSGFCVAIMDVGMNAHTVKVERHAGRAVISSFHAFFSVGSLAGAVLGALAARFDVPPLWHFGLVAGLCVIGFIGLRHQFYSYAIETPQQMGHAVHWRPQRPSKTVLFLGGLALCGFMIEGAIADWGGIFLRDHLAASLAVAPLGFAAYNVSMTIGRLGGDSLRDRWSNGNLMRTAGALATVGLVVIVLSPYVWLAVCGFFIVGLGVSIVVPILFSIAGHLPGVQGERSMAQVTLIGYAGILAGPPLLGFIAHGIGLVASFGLLAVLAAVLAVGAQWLPGKPKA